MGVYVDATDELRWYALYTASRAEKKVSERFTQEGIDHYLPLQRVKRRWSDRVKEVEIPVINGYVFVHIPISDFRKVISIYGAIAFVCEGGKPVAIHDNQLNVLRFMVGHTNEPIEYSQVSYERGEPIRITKGPLEGMLGELLEMHGKHKILVRLERFGCVSTEVPISFVQKVGS